MVRGTRCQEFVSFLEGWTLLEWAFKRGTTESFKVGTRIQSVIYDYYEGENLGHIIFYLICYHTTVHVNELSSLTGPINQF